MPRCLQMAREYHVRSVERDSLQKVKNLDENPNQGSLRLWLWLCWWFPCSSIWWFVDNLDENPNHESLWLWLWLCWWFPYSSTWWFMENLDENPYQGSLWSQTLHCWWFPFFLYDSALCKIGNIDNNWRTFLVVYGYDIFLSLER